LHTLKIQLHTPVLSVDYQQVKRLVYAVYAKTNKKYYIVLLIKTPKGDHVTTIVTKDTTIVTKDTTIGTKDTTIGI